MWREVVAPVASAYAVCALFVLAAWRWPAPRPGRSRAIRTAADLRDWSRNLVVTASGGYVALLLIVLVFGVLVVGRDGLSNAAWGSAFLLAVATPVFLVLSWASGRRSG